MLWLPIFYDLIVILKYGGRSSCDFLALLEAHETRVLGRHGRSTIAVAALAAAPAGSHLGFSLRLHGLQLAKKGNATDLLIGTGLVPCAVGNVWDEVGV